MTTGHEKPNVQATKPLRTVEECREELISIDRRITGLQRKREDIIREMTLIDLGRRE